MPIVDKFELRVPEIEPARKAQAYAPEKKMQTRSLNGPTQPCLS